MTAAAAGQVFDEQVEMVDPRYSDDLEGHAAVYAAFSSLVRMFDNRMYKVPSYAVLVW